MIPKIKSSGLYTEKEMLEIITSGMYFRIENIDEIAFIKKYTSFVLVNYDPKHGKWYARPQELNGPTIWMEEI